MKPLIAFSLASTILVALSPAFAQMGNGGTKADAERDVQAYLALWSHDGAINAAAIQRFYAPHAVYYGTTMSRAEILADKRAYIRAWPIRRYTEVPGSFSASCNATRTLCNVSAVMAWRRVSAAGRVSTGRARLGFAFVPSDGARKIARESAQILSASAAD